MVSELRRRRSETLLDSGYQEAPPPVWPQTVCHGVAGNFMPTGGHIYFLWPLPRAGPEQRCYSSVQPPMLVVFPSACNAMALSIQWSGCHMTTPWGMHRFIAGIAGPQESHVHVLFSFSCAKPLRPHQTRARKKGKLPVSLRNCSCQPPPIQRLKQVYQKEGGGGGGRFV